MGAQSADAADSCRALAGHLDVTHPACEAMRAPGFAGAPSCPEGALATVTLSLRTFSI